MDFVGPLPSNSAQKFILVIVDEYSRYPFAFPCADITSEIVIKHLTQLFCLFGSPASIHSDRGTQFESKLLREFLLRTIVVKSRTTPYRPQGNGQCERVNGTVLKTVQLALNSQGLPKTAWSSVLPAALSAIRSLLCMATNQTPHERLLGFARSSLTGTDLPDFLLNPGTEILFRDHRRRKNDALVKPVKLLETISPHFARVQHGDGRIDTVSTRDLAPCAEPISSEEAVVSETLPVESERSG